MGLLRPDLALVAPVALPLALALLALAWPAQARRLAQTGGWANLAVILSLWPMVAFGGIVTMLGGWSPPLGIVLRLDALSYAFLLLAATVFAVVGTATVNRLLAQDPGAGPLWLALIASLNALFLSGDLFNIYVTLEMVSLAAVGLCAMGGAKAVVASLRYLFVGLGGALLYLMGVALLYRATGSLDIVQVGGVALPRSVMATPLALMTLGLLLKGGFAPFHFWLPIAHGVATTGVSAVLSGVVVKTAVYLLLRIWLELAPEPGVEAARPVFAALAAVAIGVGALGALRTDRVKTLIAYSTVAQLGYLALALGFATADSRALTAVLVFALSHAFAKSGMFLAAGSLVEANGHDRIPALHDPGTRLGPAKAALAVGAVVMMGLPPTGGFLGKWLLTQSAWPAVGPAVAFVMVAGALLSGAYMLRLVAATLRGPACPPMPTARGWSALALVLCAVGVGFLGAPLMAMVEARIVPGLPTPVPLPVPLAGLLP